MNFDLAFERLLGHEGAFTDDPDDRGNWDTGIVGKGNLKGTKYGIAAMSYPNLDIKNLTEDQAKAIYRRDFWAPVHADELPEVVRFDVFDAAVNHGASQAAKWLQRAVGTSADGVIGAVTVGAARATGPLIAAYFNGQRLMFYTDLGTWPKYSKGWARRVASNLLNLKA